MENIMKKLVDRLIQQDFQMSIANMANLQVHS